MQVKGLRPNLRLKLTAPVICGGTALLARPSRSAVVLVLGVVGAASCRSREQTSIGAQDSTRFAPPAAKYEFTVQRDVMVPMRDGVRLATNIYMPIGAGDRLPAILVRTVYNKDDYGGDALKFFAGQGYVVLIQDVRGKYSSEGEYVVEAADAQDGYDAVEWAATQPWSTGKIGTYGCSYLGEVQYLLLRMRHPNHLAAIANAASGAVGPAGGLYKNSGYYEGGAFVLSTGFGWFARAGLKAKGATRPPNVDFATLLRTLPEIEIWKQAGFAPSDFEDFMRHPPADPYWDQMHYLRDDDKFATPVLQVNSWLDVTPDATLYAFNLMQRNTTSDAGREQFVVMSPTTHCGSEEASEHTLVGTMDVGDARYDYWRLYLDWFDHWLKGVDNGVTRRPRVQYYVTGKNEWRTAPSWPVPGMREVDYYLAPSTGSRANRGQLATTKPARETSQTYVYDPGDPVPSKGGTICCTGNPNDLPGVFDQSALEARNDLLVYSTEPLAQPLTIVGPIKLVLFVSSDAKDTDFSAKLLDVDLEGHAWNLVNGILRARYREGMARKVLMQRDSVYRIEVSLKTTAHQFLPGHLVRVYITSSDFPMYDRNLNTGGDNITETTWVKASNTIHQGGAHASLLSLPVTP